MIIRRSVALLLVLGVVGCGVGGDPPREVVPPPPPPLPVKTPDWELVRQVQAAYQIAFDEFERISREGGADQPSAKMLEVEQDLYLEHTMVLMRDQKKTGYKVVGKPGVAKSRTVRGAGNGDSDLRLTLQVCEDRRSGTVIERDGTRVQNHISEGFVYAKIVAGKVKLVDIDTAEVQQCQW